MKLTDKYFCLDKNFDYSLFQTERKKSHLHTFLKKSKLVIDSCLVCDNANYPYETMVFRADENGNVVDFTEVLVENFATEEEMKECHKRLIKELEIK